MGRVHGERHRGRPVITEESKRDSRRGPISLSLEVDEGREVRRWGRWTTQGLARQTGTAVARTGKPPGKPALTRRLVVLAGLACRGAA